MLTTEPRVEALRDWARALERRRGVVVPQFDPADGGNEARVLLLLEAPGPMTNTSNTRPGSGFISVDNDDQTAANVWLARDEVGLHDGVIHWNIVPWYLGTAARKPTVAELADGAAELLDLMRLLPRLETVVLAGRFAQSGWKKHLDRSLYRPVVRVIETWHPSPLSMNQPGHREHFTTALRGAASRLSGA